MTDAIPDIQNKRGRPPVGSVGVLVKLPPTDLAALDGWIEQQEPRPSRPEAIRRLIATAIVTDTGYDAWKAAGLAAKGE